MQLFLIALVGVGAAVVVGLFSPAIIKLAARTFPKDQTAVPLGASEAEFAQRYDQQRRQRRYDRAKRMRLFSALGSDPRDKHKP